jgi:hypothetical protein
VKHTERFAAMMRLFADVRACPEMTPEQRAEVMSEALAEYRISVSPRVFLQALDHILKETMPRAVVPQRSPESDPPRALPPKRVGKGRKGTSGA